MKAELFEQIVDRAERAERERQALQAAVAELADLERLPRRAERERRRVLRELVGQADKDDVLDVALEVQRRKVDLQRYAAADEAKEIRGARAGGVARGGTVSEAADSVRQNVKAKAEAYRRANVYDRCLSSTRELARVVGKRLGMPDNTVRHHLKKLKLK